MAQTVRDVLQHAQGDIEVVVVLDGAPADPPLPEDPRVIVLQHAEARGQRASINAAARLASGQYLMKLDAHCSLDQGFDVKLLGPYLSGELAQDVTTIPRMYNLHVFDWVCTACGARTYQGPDPNKTHEGGTGPRRCECGHAEYRRELVWQPRLSRRTDFARFDRNLHFQYWGGYERRPEARGELAEVLCFVGACFLMPAARYWELEGCDEQHGSWGQQGVEVSCKSWLSGGRMVVNKRAWFAHLFRTRSGFSFPYPMSVSAQEAARQYSRWLWQGEHWPKAVRSLAWLLDHFAPVPEWHDAASQQAPEAGPATVLAEVHSA